MLNNIQKYLADSSNYNKNRTYNIKYIVIHYTGNNGDTAISNAKYFASPNRNASAHYFVDNKEIIQSVLDTNIAWHCGAKTYKHPECRNNNSIGIELCSKKDNTGKFYIDKDTQSLGAKLAYELQQKYNIPDNNIIRHYDVTGKLCPEPFVRIEQDWLNFKTMIATIKNTSSTVKHTKMIYNYVDDNMPEWARPIVTKLIKKKYLLGNSKGELELNYDMLRMLAIINRTGIFDK